MPISTKEFRQIGQDLQYGLIKKGITGILPFLPHSTGRNIHHHQPATIAPYVQVVQDCAHNGSFYLALDVLICIMSEIMDESGWTMQPHSPDHFDPWSIRITVNDGVDIGLLLDSLMILVSTCEQGWAVYTAKRAGVTPPEDSTRYTIGQVARSVIAKDPALLEAIDDNLAKKTMKTLCHLAPPVIWRLRHSGEAPARDEFSTTGHMVLWAASARMLQFLVLCNGNTTFTNLHSEVVNTAFPKSPADARFQATARPELLGMARYTRENPMITFQELQRWVLDLRPASYQSVLALLYNFAIDHWLGIGFIGLVGAPECQRKSRELFNGLGHYLKNKPIDPLENQLHCLYIKMAVFLQDKQGSQISLRYIRYYQSRLASSQLDEYGSAVGILSQVSWFLFIFRKWGPDLPLVNKFIQILVDIYPQIKCAYVKVSQNFGFCTSHLPWLLSYHGSFAALDPDTYFNGHYTGISKETSASMLTSMMSLINRLRPAISRSEKKFCAHSSKVLNAITYAGRQSVEEGEDQLIYDSCFNLGLLYIIRSDDQVEHLSNQSILDFCVMVFDTLKARRATLRTKTVSAAIYLFTKMSSQGSLQVMIRMRTLLGNFLRDAEKVIEDFEYVNDSENTWNMDLIPDILSARLHVTKRIVELDASCLELDHDLEVNIRAAVIFCVCSADRDICARGVDCLKLLSEEVTIWGSGKLSASDFLQQSYIAQGMWQIMIKYPPTGGSSSLFLQKMIIKVFEKYPIPPVTPGSAKLTLASMRLWSKNRDDVDRKLSASTRKTLNNIMALVCGLAHAMSLSPEQSYRKIAFDHTVMLGSTLTSVHVGPREAAVNVVRLEYLNNPRFCIAILRDLTDGVVLPLYTKSRQPKDMDLQAYKGLSVLAHEAGRLYRIAATIDVPVRYDVSQIACMMFEHCRHMYAQGDAKLADPFFQVLILNAISENLMASSKFDTFRTVVPIIFEELHMYPDHKCLASISRTLKAVSDDYTLYSSTQSASLMDSRYRTFRSYISTMARYIKVGAYSSEIAHTFGDAIVNMCTANQEMAIVYFEEAELALQPELRSRLYQCFSRIFSVEGDSENYYSEEIIGLLIRNNIIVEGLCEVCPQEESGDFATYIGTLYCEYGHSLELAKWAFKRDLDASQRPEEIMRKNNVIVQIVLQIFHLNLKHKSRSLVRNLIRNVFDDPFIFLSMSDPHSEGCVKAVLKCVETYEPVLNDPQQYFGDAVLKFIAYMEEQVESRFPGYSNVVFRNVLFLRVICPMIVQPQSFGITPHIPEGIAREGLMKLAKYFQNVDLRTSQPDPAHESTRHMVNKLKEQMIAKGQRETQFGFEENMFSAKVIDGAFFNLRQFLYRHSRELKAYLYINTKVSSSDTSVSSYNSDSSTTFSEESSLFKEFSQLIHRLGRPTMGLLNRNRRNQSSRSYTRKNSMATWNDHDEPCVYTVDSIDHPVVVVSSDFDTIESNYYLQNELNSALAKFDLSRTYTKFYGICDNTSCVLDVPKLVEYRDALGRFFAESPIVLPFTDIIDVNTSFAYFEHVHAISLRHTKTRNARFITSLDLSVQELQQFGLRESTLTVARDIHKAEKFMGVMLEHGGATYPFTVYVGKQFIHVIGECNSCDVFTFDCVRFINGAIHLKKQIKKFSLTFIVKLGHSSAFHKKLWTLFNTTRTNSRFLTANPLLEVEARKFYSYLLCQCMFDLCNPCPNMRYSAHNLLPSIISKFQLDMPDLNIALQTSTHQPGRVAEISRSLANAHPDLVLDLLQSFITLCSHRGKIDYSIIEFITPWFQQLPVVYSTATNVGTGAETRAGNQDHNKLEILTRSLCTLHDTFDETDPASRRLVTTYLWPFMMHSKIAAVTFEIYLSYNIFRVEILNEKEGGAVYPVPVSSDVLKHIMGLAMNLMYSDRSGCKPNDFPRWSDNVNWNRFKIVLLTFSKCIFTGPEQILEVLPELIVAMYCFSAVGPHFLRQNMHQMMNNVVSQCIVMRGISVAAQDELKKLKADINSDRGMLLYGAHASMCDDNYDVFDGLPYDDAAKLSNYLIDFCAAILSPDRLSELRAQVMTILYGALLQGGVTFTRKVYFGILAFNSSKLSPAQLDTHYEYCYRLLSSYFSSQEYAKPRLLQALGSYYQIHCQQVLIWLDDESVVRYLWIALALQGLMIDLLSSSLVANSTTCLRICQMRGLHTQGISKLLQQLHGEAAADWYDRHKGTVYQVSESPAYCSSRVSYPLISLLRNPDSCQTAFEAIEAWLTVLQADSDIESTLELALLYYVFAPEKRALANSNLFGVYGDDLDNPEVPDMIVTKLASGISRDYTHGVVALLNVCQAIIDQPITSKSFKVARLLCRITDPRIVYDLEPILYPLCSNMVKILDTENHELTMMLSDAITKLESRRECSYEESLSRVWVVLDTVGRPRDIDESFVLHPPKVHDQGDGQILVAADLLKSVITWRKERLGLGDRNKKPVGAESKVLETLNHASLD